jgi:hypothetical protein
LRNCFRADAFQSHPNLILCLAVADPVPAIMCNGVK